MKIIKIKAKNAFTRTRIPGARWVINQYIGCQYACKYCYAKFMNKYYPYGEWGSWIVVKENLPDLVKGKYVEGLVYMSSVSDPYQSVEKVLKLTRKILENMDKWIRLSILTKSDLVLRDIDLFKQFRTIEVGLTINGFNGKLKKDVEPFSPMVKNRINALKELHNNGITSYAFISPIIPWLINIENLIEETRDFVDFYWFEFLNLKASGYWFKNWLKENYPKSYEIIDNEEKLKGFIDEVFKLIKKHKIKVKGVVSHYPKISLSDNA